MNPLPLPENPRRILIIKPSAIGDIVHSLPVLNLMRRRWPKAHVSWLVTPACADLLVGHPQIDELILFERRRFGYGWRSPRALWELLGFMDSMRQRRFDMVVDLQGLFRSGWMVSQTQAPVRVGFANAREGGWLFYTHHVRTSWDLHAVDRYLDMAEALGCGREPVEFVFPRVDEEKRFVDRLVPADVRYAVLVPGANWETKRWPPQRFAALVGPLRERFGLASVVAGGPADSAFAAQIPGAIDVTGKTSLRQLVALLERAQLVIGNDTGPTHIAAALRRPLVTLFGPTNAARNGPWGRMDGVVQLDIPCSPCYSRQCSHQSCLQWLAWEPVLAAAAQQVSLGSSSAGTPFLTWKSQAIAIAGSSGL